MSGFNSTSVAGPPDQTAALIANIIQASIFVSVGPFVAIYGPAIFRVTTLLRSLFAMNYLSWVLAVSAVDEMTAFEVFTDRLAVLAAGVMTLTIASLRSRKIRAYAAGAVLGTMVATPLVELIRQHLYFGTVGCTGIGEKTAIFPEGEPIGCDHTSQKFQLTFQLTKALMVCTVAGFAFLGKKLMGFSIAMMGSTMIVEGGMGLLQVILLEYTDDQDLATQIIRTFSTIDLFVTYGIAALGYALQKLVLDYRIAQAADGLGENDEIRELKAKLRAAQQAKAKEDGKMLQPQEFEAFLKDPKDIKLCSCFARGPLRAALGLLHVVDELLRTSLEGSNEQKAKISPLGMVKRLWRRLSSKRPVEPSAAIMAPQTV